MFQVLVDVYTEPNLFVTYGSSSPLYLLQASDTLHENACTTFIFYIIKLDCLLILFFFFFCAFCISCSGRRKSRSN
jgi:hypothetical protein